MSSLIITPNIGDAIVTSADAARARRDEILALAQKVVAVVDRLDFDDASSTLKALKLFSKEIAAHHSEAKAPVLDIGRKIDAMKRELIATVEDEANRLSRILGAFESEERRKAEDARRAADAEIARVAHEALRRSR